ncbi:hypothetical protein ACFL6D_03185 [Spirochaetota bacterium]
MTFAFAAEIKLTLYNSAYVYNAESGTGWEETRTTITYFGNVLQPTCTVDLLPGLFFFTGGIAIFTPFDQESKIADYFPYIQSRLTVKDVTVIMGNLEAEHDFPGIILDPMVYFIPEMRIISASRVPVTHGCYEYGLQCKWDRERMHGEVYINWQLKDTEAHRERFDVGLIQTGSIGLLPFYVGGHYWHNGGQEHGRAISYTENYVGAVGLKSEKITLLYTASYFLPDREIQPELNVFGEGIYINSIIPIGPMEVSPSLWITDEFFNEENKFISVEGDPFYRIPLYIGFDVNVIHTFAETVDLRISLINGVFLPDTESKFNWKMIRYDQTLRIFFTHTFDSL